MVASIAKPASPSEIMKTWPLYRVATQMNKGDEVQIRTVRCPDLNSLLAFLRRLLNTQNLGTLAFLEVHQLNPDGTVTILMEDVNKQWPADVARHRIDGILTPKIPTVEDANKAEKAARDIARMRQEERERTQQAGRNVLEKAIADARGSMPPPPVVTPPASTVAPDPEDEELGRPVRTHKRGVA